MDSARDLLRHAVATIAYRGGKALRDAPPDFEAFKPADTSRTPAQILAHIGDLFDWALSMAKGAPAWHVAAPQPWEQEVARFYQTLHAFDAYLATDAPLGAPAHKLFQGPVADALTHIGQLTMLRRVSGAAIRGENYYVADIAAGRIGAEQSAPVREFD
jgi:hypothetical protein